MNLAEIVRFGRDRYGCELCACNSLTALWIVQDILDECGHNVFAKVSRYREGHGLPTSFPEYGTPLFNTISTTDES